MDVNVLIVEDEILVAEDLSDFLADCGFKVTGIAINSTECFECINNIEPHIIIMDITLKGKLDGIEIAHIINQTKKIPLIFLTANSEPSTIAKALPLKPCAFISKPFHKNDVKVAIELACQNYNDTVMQATIESPETIAGVIFVKDGSHYRRIEIASILYIEAKGSYSEIVTVTKSYTLSYNLSHFTEQVKNPGLRKVHRSFIVNINKVEAFDNTSLIINKIMIPVSRQYHKEVMNLFQKL